MVVEILFLAFNNTDFQFGIKKLTQRSYIAAKALSITREIEYINKRELGKIVLNKYFKILEVYMVILEAEVLIY